MKKSILILFLFLLQKVNAQNNFPRFHVDNGDTIGVLFSVNQSKEILNDKKRLALYKNLKSGCDSLLYKYWSINAKYEESIGNYSSLIELYKKNDSDQITMIKNRETKIENLTKDLKKCDEQFVLKNEENINNLKIIDEMKQKQNWLLGGSIGFGVLSVLLTGMILGN